MKSHTVAGRDHSGLLQADQRGKQMRVVYYLNWRGEKVLTAFTAFCFYLHQVKFPGTGTNTPFG